MNSDNELLLKAQAAKQAARKLAILPTTVKNQILSAMAAALINHKDFLLKANHRDVRAGREKKLSEALLDRLLLTEARIEAMAQGLLDIVALPDPIGEGLSTVKRPNGLEITKVRVPLGVIGIIYEARPNVTADAAGLCLKSGNAVILRGGSEANESNQAIMKVMIEAGKIAGLPEGALALIESTDRALVQQMLKLNEYLDVIIPRGGKGLIDTVVKNSTVPVIETGTGVCHTYIAEDADIPMALSIAYNAKVSRPGVCNAMETLLIHQDIAKEFIPEMFKQYRAANVELRGCPKVCALDETVKPATEEDWSTEYHDYILSVKIVESLDEALDHIDRYSTKHSECIVTQSYSKARRFQHEVDAAAVYANASTRFTDGGEFGFGAEIGISTQKLHARGPMGLKELTTVKYIVAGDGQIR